MPRTAGGTPGTRSQRSPRLCSTVQCKGRQHADLAPEGAQGSSPSVGCKSPLLAEVVTWVRHCSPSLGPTLRDSGKFERIESVSFQEYSAGPAPLPPNRCLAKHSNQLAEVFCPLDFPVTACLLEGRQLAPLVLLLARVRGQLA